MTWTVAPGETKSVEMYRYLVPPAVAVFTLPGLVLVGVDFFNQVADSNCQPAHFGDARLNAYDIAAPLAAYCASGGITVWDIAPDSQGTLAFTAPLAAIHDALAQAQTSGQSVLIGEGLGDSLYALPSNQLQFTGPDVNDAKTYQFIAAGNVCG